MTFEPLQPRDKRLAGVALLLIAAAAWYTLRNYEAAFPQASLDLRYSKSEITRLAEEALHKRGLSVEGYRNLTIFEPDDSARLFLERELGLEEANRLMAGEVAVWQWRARWFKPPEEEELLVYLSPDGRLVGFDHIVPESEAGARLERDEALGIARGYLQERTTLPHRLIEDQSRERPNRLDYVFTWEREGFRAKDATYRRRVVIQGGEVGRYSEYLHVPERWDREYAGLRSGNELYSGIAQAFYVVLILAAIAVLVLSLRRQEIQWRPLIAICGGAAALAVLNEWNLLPFYIDAEPTSTPFHQTLATSLLQGVGAGVGYFFYIMLGAASGEPLYRAFQPDRLSLGAAFSGRGTRTREFFRATVAGYGFTAVHLIFLIAFYLVSQRFGAWSPQDVGYSDLLSTAAPWLYPMTIGVLASTSEEFWFRLLAVPLLKRFTGSTWIAVLVPAFVWGFLHANYPQQPGFIRGVEVGIIGVFAGLLLLRFGILATLIWHYTIDALLVSTILFESGSPYFWGSGIIVTCAVLVPLGISLVQYRKNGGFLASEPLRNRSAPAPPRPAAHSTGAERPAKPVRPAWSVKWLYLASAGALGLGAFLQPFQFGDFISVRVSASEARSIAAAALSERGVDASDWRISTGFHTNLETADFEYVRRIAGRDAANEAVRERTFHGIWVVRHLRPGQPEEWRVYVNQEGAAYRIDHVLEETAEGEDLTPEQAQELAERRLADFVPAGRFRLVRGRYEVNTP